ncbi:transcription factor Ouib isoform X3 [Drosophila innubila]|uniref:transcription factor Ouib isoform X2 n=1 Tax=Drosophila innubila TaxID=198719 RepID=UPI00148D42F5|nr:transcription factor Ouib isoform X2 [Drosophila innubila]XP_034475569.1 transcription factor Ouib isoform X3 [Drosophila innubila]
MLQNICRICAVDANVSEVTKLFEKSARKLLRQINLLTGVFLEASSDLPNVICKICLNDLACAIEFRRRCLRNHRRWQSKKSVEPEPDPEPAADVDVDVDAQSTYGICVRRSARTNERFACDQEDEVPLGALLKVDHPKYETDEVDHLDVENNTGIDQASDFSVSEAELLVTPIKSKRSSRLVKSTFLKRPRSRQKLPVFFCDQCGNNVTGKSAFDRHLRKHSGIRPFQCEQCPSRFLSAGELKGHQVMHTGDRNFQCQYCERTYVNHSGRKRHERTHTNERPFACIQCGKSFTNSYILKNHMLVHTGERMYRCDLCDRAFSRPTHLNTHYRSNTHKQNVEKSCAGQQQVIIMEKSESGFALSQDTVGLKTEGIAKVEVPLGHNQF